MAARQASPDRHRATWIAGVALALVGAGIGYLVHLLVPAAPWLTVAFVLGLALGCIPTARPLLDGLFKPGLAIAARRLLRLGIVLLGLKVSLETIAALGWIAIVAIVLLVVVSFAITLGIARLFRLEGDQPVLLAAGFSICGVSAVGAMSAARGSSARDSETPVAAVTLFGTLAIVVLPPLGGLFGLSPMEYGHWVGASVHDVGQVVATAQTAGATALAAAIVVKLTRVLMLAPMTAVASVLARRNGGTTGKRAPIVPLFIVGFVVAVLLRSFVPLPQVVLDAADVLQSVFLAAALFAIGASLRIEKLVHSGGRAFGAGLVSWIVILAISLAMVLLVPGLH